jgi:acetylornithine deacetylase
VIDLLATWLGDLGFACDIQQVSPGKFNLLASFGSGPGGLVLAGHSDTVPYDEALWQTDPLKLTEVDNRWVGLGSCDMKGFFALAIEAVRPLLDQPFKQPLLILATCDEESSMAGARALAEAGRPLGRAAVIGEPTGLKPIRLHKGVMMERIDILGRSGHSSDPAWATAHWRPCMTPWASCAACANNGWQRIPQPAVQRAAADPELSAASTVAITPTAFAASARWSSTCGPCRAWIPRCCCEASSASKLQPIAERHQVQIDFAPLFPEVPPFEQAADAELVRVAERLTGHRAEAVAFGTEAPYLQRLGCETLVLGPGDIACAHQPGEHLEMSRLQPTVRLLQEVD